MTHYASPAMVGDNEAAVLSIVEVRDVYRAFDEWLLPESLLGNTEAGRQVAHVAMPLLAFYLQAVGFL